MSTTDNKDGKDGKDKSNLPPDLQADPEMAEAVGDTKPEDLTPEQAMLARLGTGSSEERLTTVEDALKLLFS